MADGAAEMMDSYLPDLPARMVDPITCGRRNDDGVECPLVLAHGGDCAPLSERELTRRFIAARREQIAAESEWDAMDMARGNARCNDAAKRVRETEAALLAAVPDQKEQR